MGKKKTTEQFIEDARKVHGDKYDYSKVVYKNNYTKVIIDCPIHGEFRQIPSHHLNGHGCSKCATDITKSKVSFGTDIFIERAKKYMVTNMIIQM